MKDNYKSALDKMKLSESEKDRAKALFYGINEEREKNMRLKRLFKPVVAVAASLAIVLAVDAMIPMIQSGFGNTSSNTVVDNYFTVTAYAKELTKTGKVFSDKYSSLGFAMCGTENDGISFAFDFPVKCKGENIDTITYEIEEGAFQISNPKGKSIVVDGEKVEKELNVPGSSMESEENEVLTYEFEQYKSFTVNYENQSNDKTCIDVVDTSDIWSKEKLSQYKDFGYSICDSSLKEKKEVCDFLMKDQGITCTVRYKDGSTETKKIVVSNEIVKPSEVFDEEIPEEKNQESVAMCFSIQ